ncbi:MAG: 3-deoxy-7-phosphoheptulonate synthase [Rhodothermia bacterium]|nr:MAG: 3-deoxy-7-phosphoheptulonate synthase [Rhodothermia bacterium]
MVVIMQFGATESQIEAVIDQLSENGFDVHRSSGSQQTVLGAIGVQPDFDIRHIRLLEGVGDVHRVTEPFKFASRTWKKENSIIRVGDVEIGSDDVAVMAGPCSIESEDQIEKTAAHVASCGATILRGGAFKPRSSPYSFQGLGLPGLKLMRAAADRHGLHVITEVMDVAQLESVLPLTDIVQVGARNMQNYTLLKGLGKIRKPVLLKRGLMATIEEWLMSAEYIMAEGNQEIILCERGIRTFETYTRNTLDLSAVPVVRAKSHLPIIVDPSHGTGLRNKVIPMARAAIAAGADGLLIETHPDPEHARSDGPQSLYFDQFVELMRQISLIAEAIGRSVGQVQAT